MAPLQPVPIFFLWQQPLLCPRLLQGEAGSKGEHSGSHLASWGLVSLVPALWGQFEARACCPASGLWPTVGGALPSVLLGPSPGCDRKPKTQACDWAGWGEGAWGEPGAVCLVPTGQFLIALAREHGDAHTCTRTHGDLLSVPPPVVTSVGHESAAAAAL